jgi:hypothetical protein
MSTSTLQFLPFKAPLAMILTGVGVVGMEDKLEESIVKELALTLTTRLK